MGGGSSTTGDDVHAGIGERQEPGAAYPSAIPVASGFSRCVDLDPGPGTDAWAFHYYGGISNAVMAAEMRDLQAGHPSATSTYPSRMNQMATSGTDMDLNIVAHDQGRMKRLLTRQCPFWLGGVLVGLAEIVFYYHRSGADVRHQRGARLRYRLGGAGLRARHSLDHPRCPARGETGGRHREGVPRLGQVQLAHAGDVLHRGDCSSPSEPVWPRVAPPTTSSVASHP